MKIRELRRQAGSTTVPAWPPQWVVWGGRRSPGNEGTIVGAAWGYDRRKLRITNRFEDHECEGHLLVDHPETTLPRILDALSARVPISVKDTGELELPREVPYSGYTIEASSYQGQPPGGQWGWLAKALIVWDQHGELHHQPVFDTESRFFETQEEADLLAFQIGRTWIDQNG